MRWHCDEVVAYKRYSLYNNDGMYSNVFIPPSTANKVVLIDTNLDTFFYSDLNALSADVPKEWMIALQRKFYDAV
jgi:hypothetical protein